MAQRRPTAYRPFRIRQAGRTRHRRRLLFESLETRELLTAGAETTLYDDHVSQLVTISTESSIDAPQLTFAVNGVPKAAGNQIHIYHAVAAKSTDRRMVFVLDTNGYLRLRNPDASAAAGQETPFGSSLILPPGLITASGTNEHFFLRDKLQSVNLVTNDSSGNLHLHASGIPASSTTTLSTVAVSWDIEVPTTTPAAGQLRTDDVTNASIDVTVSFRQEVSLSQSRMAEAQAFQVAKFSSSNVPADHTQQQVRTHDADQLRLVLPNGQLSPAVDLDTAAPNTLLFGPGLVAGGTLELNQIHPAPLNGDPPNLSVRVTSPTSNVEYRAQAYLAVDSTINQDSDNLSAWLSRTFASPRIAAGTSLKWTLDVAARGQVAPASALRFLVDSANLYSVSSNPMDLGSPIVPLYTDYQAGGTYAEYVYYDGLDGDPYAGDDPDAGRGTSSYRMTLQELGLNGYLIFDLGQQWVRPGLDFGAATRLRYLAKGDQAGQILEVKVLGQLPDGADTVSLKQPLTTTWQDYELTLPAGLQMADIEQVHFVLDPADNQGQGTVRLDEVRVQTERYDPLRVLQSYRPNYYQPDAVTAANYRDGDVYPYQSYLYDQALALVALFRSGETSAQQVALDVVDAILSTQQANQAFNDILPVGHVLGSDGTPRTPTVYSAQRLGDNAWFGLALLRAYRLNPSTGAKYLTAARQISDWAESTLRDSGAIGGYYGGLDELGQVLPYRSTEQNIDLYALNSALAVVLTGQGSAAASEYAARAQHAGDFVISLFDSVEGKFWSGTSDGDTLNEGSVPLDSQLWAVLALSISKDYSQAIDWRLPLQWAAANLTDTDGAVSGYTYSSDAKVLSPNHVWYEGTAYVALANEVTRQGDFAALLQTLAGARPTDPNGEGAVAASSDDLSDPLLGDVAYDRRQHVGATAWTYFAERAINPFPGGPGFDEDHPWRNIVAPTDVNDDSAISALDVLVLINRLNANGTQTLPKTLLINQLPPPFADVNGDDHLTALDVLSVINDLNRNGPRAVGEGEAAAMRALGGEGEAVPGPLLAGASAQSARRQQAAAAGTSEPATASAEPRSPLPASVASRRASATRLRRAPDPAATEAIFQTLEQAGSMADVTRILDRPN